MPAVLGAPRIGHVVFVPLGKQGETGYIVDLLPEPDFDPARIKAVSRLLDPEPPLTKTNLRSSDGWRTTTCFHWEW